MRNGLWERRASRYRGQEARSGVQVRNVMGETDGQLHEFRNSCESQLYPMAIWPEIF